MHSSSSSSSNDNNNNINNTDWFRVLPSVQSALTEGRPVVALESTILAHGMPYPHNVTLAHQVEQILRERGVEPATIAVRNDTVCIGLTRDELEELSQAGAQGLAVKCSTRELSLFLAQQRRRRRQQQQEEENATVNYWGATTVASTMTLAHAAGIATFVTGGIGGVHRGAQDSMDISADLMELSRTPVIVVSAGIKSILDIRRTLEVLETYGVPTVAYQTHEFPAFFSPTSNVAAPARVDSAEQVAAAYWAARDLFALPRSSPVPQHGMLVAVPNQDPAGEQVEAAIQAALAEAEERSIQGPAVTPFILKRVAEQTAGESLKSNMALVQRNAQVGAEIAIALAEERKRRMGGETGSGSSSIVHSTEFFLSPQSSPEKSTTNRRHARVVVLGGAIHDIIAQPFQKVLPGTSNPGTCHESFGGVGRNVAEVLGRLGEPVLFCSAIGPDARGTALLDHLQSVTHGRVQTDGTTNVVANARTATYLAVLDTPHSFEEANDSTRGGGGGGGGGDLFVACADTSILSEHIQPPSEDLFSSSADGNSVDILVMDANPSVPVLREAARRARRAAGQCQIFLEPTSVPKARLVAQDDELMSYLNGAFPNSDELAALAFTAISDSNDLNELEELARSVLRRMNSRSGTFLVITLGESGVLLAEKSKRLSSQHFHDEIAFSFQYFPVKQAVQVQNATGAGDSLCGAFVYALLQGKSKEDAVRIGMRAASLSLCENTAISSKLSEAKLFP